MQTFTGGPCMRDVRLSHDVSGLSIEVVTEFCASCNVCPGKEKTEGLVHKIRMPYYISREHVLELLR